MCRAFLVSIFILVLGFTLHPAEAKTTCSNKQMKKLYAKGMSIKKIADRCNADEDDVESIVEPEEDCTDNSCNDPTPQPPRQAMCCDTYGNSRCPIVAGSTTIGTGCFCPGQGYGLICR